MVLIHMLVGIPASGKSTYANKLSAKLNIPIVSSDAVRMKNPDILEKDIWPMIYEECFKCIENNQDFIFDATNINKYIRDLFKSKLLTKTNDFEIGTYTFLCDPDVCYKRCVERNKNESEHHIPPEVIYEYAIKIELPSIDEGFVFRKVIQ